MSTSKLNGCILVRLLVGIHWNGARPENEHWNGINADIYWGKVVYSGYRLSIFAMLSITSKAAEELPHVHANS